MECNHEQVRCTNGVFYCLKCGKEVPNPYMAGNDKGDEAKATEAKKPASKRKAKKESGIE